MSFECGIMPGGAGSGFAGNYNRLRMMSTVLLCLSALVFFVLPVHALETIQPGSVQNPTFGPNEKNVMSLKGDKGDSGSPWGGGEFTGGVKFKEGTEFQKKVGIGAAVSETGSVFGVSLIAGKGVRIGNWGLDGGSALFVTPATTSQEVAVIRGLAGQAADIFRAETSDGSKQIVFRSSGNVGIGLPDPVARLQVKGGEIRSDGAFRAIGGGGSDGWFRSHPAGNFLEIGTLNASDISLMTNSTERVRITSGGGVGIGSAPGSVYKLDVAGKANATELCIAGDCKPSWIAIGGIPTLQEVTDKGNATTKSLQAPSVTGGQSTGKLILVNTSQDNGAFIELHGKDFSNDATRKGELTLGTYGTSGRHQFLNYNGSTWTPLMSVYPNGRVGIGTGYSTPGAKLHVVNTNTQPIAYFEGKDLRTDPGNTDPSSYVFLKDQDAPNAWGLRVGNSGDFGIHQSGTADRITVLNNGNVGIGAANPQAKLEVEGRVSSHGIISVNERWTPVPQELNINSNQIWKSGISGTDPTLYLQWSNPGGAVRVGGQQGATNSLIVDGGAKIRDRLGVGRDADDMQLEVANSIEIQTEDVDNLIRFHDPSDRWISMGLDRSDGNKFKINEGGTVGYVNHFVMDGSGNVGIGKDVNATYRLDVAGKTNAVELCLGGDCKSSWSQVAPAAQQPITGASDGTIDWGDVVGRPLGLDDGDNVGITNESDPTVAANVKDGVAWDEVSGKPSLVPASGGTFTGNVTMNQALQVNGDLVAGNNVASNCHWLGGGDIASTWGWKESSCPDGEFVAGMKFGTSYSSAALDFWDVKCCKL